MCMAKDKLFTYGYMAILGANFLLFFAFYLILPVLPFFLKEAMGAENSTVGLVLAVYTVAALTVRPFAGYLLDSMARKPLYVAMYAVFTAVFGGYVVAVSLFMVVVIRAIHGLAFGIVTVAGNTIVIDIMPSARRGEGLGYYGLANNIAMATGPMVGLFLHEYVSFNVIFMISMLSGTIGLVLASTVKTKQRPPVVRPPLQLDRFLLLKGIPAGVALLLISIPYGITSSYIALYAKELDLGVSSGLFFTFMAAGMMTSRIFSGRLVDRGYIPQVIKVGMVIVTLCYVSLAGLKAVVGASEVAADVLFVVTALTVGVGFGIIFPAYNTLFVNLAEHNRRGTATSTYLTSWDVGIGLGLVSGGIISQNASFSWAYVMGSGLCMVSTLLFFMWVSPHFVRNKLR